MTNPKLIEREEKPREWWIQMGTPDIIAESVKEMAECQDEDRLYCHIHHVIEHSAYTALEHKLEVAIEALEKIARKCLDDEPPYRYAPDKFLQDYARTALATIKGAKTDE